MDLILIRKIVQGFALAWAIICAFFCFIGFMDTSHDSGIDPTGLAIQTIIGIAVFWVAGKILS
jgi:hypothetical protein